MARNRKNQSAVFKPAVWAAILCLLIGGSGVGYVWQKDQISRLGRQIKQREQRLMDVAEQNEKLKKQLSTMRLPASLALRIKELNLGLVPPQPGQIWHMSEPSREPLPPSREAQLAAGEWRAGAGPGQ